MLRWALDIDIMHNAAYISQLKNCISETNDQSFKPVKGESGSVFLFFCKRLQGIPIHYGKSRFEANCLPIWNGGTDWGKHRLEANEANPLEFPNFMAMLENEIPDENGNGAYLVFQGGNVEYVDPLAHFAEGQIHSRAKVMQKLVSLEDPDLAAMLPLEFFIKKATEDWEEDLPAMLSVAVPENFIKLLSTTRKKEQERLLKGQSFTMIEFFNLLVRAHQEFGYTFSRYRFDQPHKEFGSAELPQLIHVENDSVKSVGKTNLTDGQLKQVVNQKKAVIANFLDRDDEWHCLFVVYKSLRGEESWKGGQPHYHYISDKFNITREDALKQFRGEKYPGSSIHIDLLDSRTPS